MYKHDKDKYCQNLVKTYANAIDEHYLYRLFLVKFDELWPIGKEKKFKNPKNYIENHNDMYRNNKDIIIDENMTNDVLINNIPCVWHQFIAYRIENNYTSDFPK